MQTEKIEFLINELEDLNKFFISTYYIFSKFKHAVLLNSHKNEVKSAPYSKYSFLAGASNKNLLKATTKNFDVQLNKIQNSNKYWFGNLFFEAYKYTEPLLFDTKEAENIDCFRFFEADIVLYTTDNKVVIESYDSGISVSEILKQIKNFIINTESEIDDEWIKVYSNFTDLEYINTVKGVKNKILNGDVYQLNLCQKFTIESKNFIPLRYYLKKSEQFKSPFSAFLQTSEETIGCFSMERYLAKYQDKLISQPIKGTLRASGNTDTQQKEIEQLEKDAKERAENIMIVDMVRNDLAKVSKVGSVRVEELAKPYTYNHVHQLISTITSTLKDGITLSEIFKATFPMASMTGAPKVAALKYIKDLEKSNRGSYSGAIGYFSPDGDFDLNVVIRSFFYNMDLNKLEVFAGAGITWNSIPEKEYEECLLKVEHLLK